MKNLSLARLRVKRQVQPTSLILTIDAHDDAAEAVGAKEAAEEVAGVEEVVAEAAHPSDVAARQPLPIVQCAVASVRLLAGYPSSQRAISSPLLEFTTHSPLP